MEVEPFNISVTTINPGIVKTYIMPNSLTRLDRCATRSTLLLYSRQIVTFAHGCLRRVSTDRLPFMETQMLKIGYTCSTLSTEPCTLCPQWSTLKYYSIQCLPSKHGKRPTQPENQVAVIACPLTDQVVRVGFRTLLASTTGLQKAGWHGEPTLLRGGPHPRKQQKPLPKP